MLFSLTFLFRLEWTVKHNLLAVTLLFECWWVFKILHWFWEKICCAKGLAWWRVAFRMGPLCTFRLMTSHFTPAINLPPFTFHFSNVKPLARILPCPRTHYSLSLEYLFLSHPSSKCFLLLQDLDQASYLQTDRIVRSNTKCALIITCQVLLLALLT